jgi:hypothetical protein
MARKMIFSPQDFLGVWKLKERLRGNYANYSWHYPFGRFKRPEWFMLKVFGRLHYLSSHAPDKVQKKYRKAAERFERAHYGSHRFITSRFANKYTAHRYN